MKKRPVVRVTLGLVGSNMQYDCWLTGELYAWEQSSLCKLFGRRDCTARIKLVSEPQPGKLDGLHPSCHTAWQGGQAKDLFLSSLLPSCALCAHKALRILAGATCKAARMP